jgi:hypothetical protein
MTRSIIVDLVLYYEVRYVHIVDQSAESGLRFIVLLGRPTCLKPYSVVLIGLATVLQLQRGQLATPLQASWHHLGFL